MHSSSRREAEEPLGGRRMIPGWLVGAPPGLVEQYENQFTKWYRFLRKAAGHVSQGRTKRDVKVIRLARREIERTQKDWNKLGALSKTACRQGCAMCCYFRVDVAAAEAECIAGLVERLPEERRNATVTRLRAGKAAEERNPDAGSYRHPCPFLDGAECSIYEDRPLTCRSCVSPNVRICELSMTQVSVQPSVSDGISVEDLRQRFGWLVVLNSISNAALRLLGKTQPLATAVLEQLGQTPRHRSDRAR